MIMSIISIGMGTEQTTPLISLMFPTFLQQILPNISLVRSSSTVGSFSIFLMIKISGRSSQFSKRTLQGRRDHLLCGSVTIFCFLRLAKFLCFIPPDGKAQLAQSISSMPCNACLTLLSTMLIQLRGYRSCAVLHYICSPSTAAGQHIVW